MKEFFFPESVAIYGVSAAPGNIGIGVLENLERFSFKGNVFLVGEKGGSVKRRNIVKSIDEIESTPDVAVFIIPATGIPDKLDECGKKGVRYAIIESGGFSEFGTEKESLEKEIKDLTAQLQLLRASQKADFVLGDASRLAVPISQIGPGKFRVLERAEYPLSEQVFRMAMRSRIPRISRDNSLATQLAAVAPSAQADGAGRFDWQW